MSVDAGPRGSTLVIEPARDVPLVWFEIHVRGGSAADPPGGEGFTRHAAELARRGAGGKSRTELDEALEALGASLDLSTGRDAFTLHGVTLARNADRALSLAADVLARPAMDADEDARLRRETIASLDEVRDDDNSLALRYFTRHCAPGHPYSRTALGTVRSIEAFDLDAVRAYYRRAVVPGNLVIGFAGDVTEQHARGFAERLVIDLDAGAAPALPDVSRIERPHGRHAVLVDKPERQQTQLLIGHAGPSFGDDYAALSVVETAFGGMFTSRLMQEIRVKRGWSYGAGCRLGRARGPQWFRIALAPSAEVAPEAVALTLELFDALAQEGLSADEVDFARSYLGGSWPFQLATARDRLRLATEAVLADLPADFLPTLPAKIDAVTRDDTRRAIERWMHPEDALTVLVATADELLPRLGHVPLGPIDVVPYDAY